MPDTTQNLAMPFILPAQAQKHVTHNEALLVLDGAVQLCVEAIGQNDPPDIFADGQIWAVGPSPTGDWAGYAGALAMRASAGWLYINPRPGWRAWDRTSDALRVYRGGQWGALPLQQVEGLGIGTGFDGTNRLAVVSPATLLSHDGAGHQLKINKAAVGDTGSLLFQTDWSGRAEMGLAGSDAFAIKVSPDGMAWVDALVVVPASGQVALPAGALLAPGSAGAPSLAFTDDADTGLHHPGADQIGAATGGVRRWLLTNAGFQIDVPVTGLAVTQSAADVTAGRLLRTEAGPAQAFRRGNVLGAVSQSGGVPTGAVIERGSNANGDYTRFADGTQICAHVGPGVACQTGQGALFMNATLQGWTFPAAFATGTVPVVSGNGGSTARFMGGTVGSNTSFSYRVMSAFSDPAAVAPHLMAFGRWF
ncbi:MAG: DUF2793 domain-containing protein [Paracoccaceae bacterium]